MLGLIGVNLRSRITSSRGFFAIRAVFSAVLMVLTWCSMKPLDLGRLGGGCEVLYVVMQEKIKCKLPRCKGLAIVH